MVRYCKKCLSRIDYCFDYDCSKILDVYTTISCDNKSHYCLEHAINRTDTLTIVKEIHLSNLINLSMQFTEEYEKIIEKWDYRVQIAHIHSEVSETYNAIRHNEGIDKIQEEIADIILTTFTLINILKYSTYGIETALINKSKIIYERLDKLKGEKQ